MSEQILQKAKTQVMLKSVFFTTIMLGLKQEITNQIPTAATDGTTIFYNPNFLERNTHEENVGLIMHELGHVAYAHLSRRGTRNSSKWNRACDYAINQILIDQGYELPHGSLLDESYRGVSADEIYNVLPDKEEQTFVVDILEPKNKQETTQRITELLSKAKLQTQLTALDKAIPSEILDLLDSALNPQLDWNTVLANYMQSYTKDDYSFLRPNKRFLPDFYLPSLYSETIISLVVAIDTSGSVSPEEIAEYLSEIQHIRNTFEIEKLTILACDYKLRNVHNVSPSDEIKDLEIKGGTFTLTEPVLTYCNRHNPKVLIYFTDLMVDDIPDEEQSFDIIWINTYDNREAKIGKTICTRR